jgi:hypothetical protein
MQHFTIAQLRATYDAGKVLAVTLKAEGGSFEMRIETQGGPATLVKTRSKSDARRFPDPRKALLLLHELGIHQTHIDGENWRPKDQVAERQPRPDRAEVMKAAHDALARTDWLQQKLARSSADTAPVMTHEQVLADAQAIIDRKRNALAKNA